MASNHFLTVKTHLSEFKNNSDKDTVSEVSIISNIHIAAGFLIKYILWHFYVRHFGDVK